MIQTRDVKSAENSGGQCAPGFFLDDVCGDESAVERPLLWRTSRCGRKVPALS